MCVLVEVLGKWCETVGDLRDSVPCEPVKSEHYGLMPPDDACLCGIDISKTLDAAGVLFFQDEGGDFHVNSE